MARPQHGADPLWSWAELEYLTFLAGRSYSAQACADAIGRSRLAVLNKARREGVRFAKHSRGGAPAGNTNGRVTWFGGRDGKLQTPQAAAPVAYRAGVPKVHPAQGGEIAGGNYNYGSGNGG